MKYERSRCESPPREGARLVPLVHLPRWMRPAASLAADLALGLRREKLALEAKWMSRVSEAGCYQIGAELSRSYNWHRNPNYGHKPCHLDENSLPSRRNPSICSESTMAFSRSSSGGRVPFVSRSTLSQVPTRLRVPVRSRIATLVISIVALVATTVASRTQTDPRGLRIVTPNEGSGRRLALVIGNNEYSKVPRLTNAVNDAKDLAAALQQMKFTVDLALNAPLETLDRRVRDFTSRVQPADVALFYFAGHGVQIDQENYLLATDFDATDDIEAKRRSVSASDVLERLRTRRARLRILILDACRDNPFQRRNTRSIAAGLATMQAEGSLIAFATSPGNTSADNATGRNGLFTEHLLRSMTVAGKEAVDVLRQVQEDVYRASGEKQLPWINFGYVGSFFFIAPRVDQAAHTKLDANIEEEGFWRAAESSQDPKLIEQYLQRYGENSRHGVQARVILARRRAHDASLTGTTGSIPTERPSVAVLGFRNHSGRGETNGISTALSEYITTELAVTNHIRAISGEEVTRLKQELSLPDTDTLALDTLNRIKRNVNADVVILGSFLTFGTDSNARIRVNMVVQDTHTGSTIAAFTVDGVSGNGLFDVISDAGLKLRNTLGLPARSSTETTMVRAAIARRPDATQRYAEGVARLREFDALQARDLLLQAVKLESDYALAHAALATAWRILGQDNDASRAAQKAMELSGNLSSESRLLIEARFYEMSREWGKAIDVYQELVSRAPDNLEYGLALAEAQQLSGKARVALGTAALLRKMPPPSRDDARIDIIVAETSADLSDFDGSRRAAADGARKGIAATAWLIVARARIAEAWALQRLGRRNEARAANEDAKRLYATAGDRRGISRALIQLGSGLRAEGKRQEAENHFREALAILRELGNQRHIARAANNLGGVLYDQGQFVEARSVFSESLTTFREIGDRLSEAMTLNNLAAVIYELDEPREALRLDEQALVIRREIGDISGTAMSLVNIAEGASDQGELVRAREMYDEAIRLYTKTGNQAQSSHAFSGLGAVLFREGRLPEARLAHEQALQIRTRLGENTRIAESRLAIAEIDLYSSDPAAVEPTVRTLLADAATAPLELQARTQALLGSALLKQGRTAEAELVLSPVLQIDDRSLSKAARFSVGIQITRLEASLKRFAAALSRIRALRGEAEDFVAYRLAVRLVEGEVLSQFGDPGAQQILISVATDADKYGFGLIAGEARRLRGMER